MFKNLGVYTVMFILQDGPGFPGMVTGGHGVAQDKIIPIASVATLIDSVR